MHQFVLALPTSTCLCITCINSFIAYHKNNFEILTRDWSSDVCSSDLSTINSSTKIAESRDKSFVLDLKILFTIVNCFLGRFPPRFFFCETSVFH